MKKEAKPEPAKTEKDPPRKEEPPYLYEPKTNLIHVRGCPMLPAGESDTIGFQTLKTPLKKEFVPCECCKSEYKKALRERNRDIIERTEYTYVYAADSDVFHKYTCGAVLSAKTILGARKYTTAVKTGRRPCKLCKPSADDVCRPKFPQTQSVRSAGKSRETEQQLPRAGKRAVTRQKVAKEERNRLLRDDSLTEQERDDVFTLTQPGFAFWAGKGYQTFHLHGCPRLQELGNLRGFATYQEAVRAGYTPCRQCKPTAKHNVIYSIPITDKARPNVKIEDLEDMCRNAGYTYIRDGKYLCVETPVGKWRIDAGVSPVRLEHINLVKTPDATNYHEQPRLFLSLSDVFDYIRRHDVNLEKKAKEGNAGR